MRKNVLIYPGNTFTAIQVFDCLKYSLRYRPIIGNHGTAHAEYVTKDFYSDLPLINDPDFIQKINDFIETYEISFIIPLHDTVCNEIMLISDRIKATIICSPYETTSIIRHKRKTYEMLRQYDFTPTIYNELSEITEEEFPVFIKDDIGQGGKKSFKCDSKKEAEERIGCNPGIDYVISEYLPGTEITIDCFTDRYGELLFYQPRERVSILDGMSGRAEIVPTTDEISYICNEINKVFRFRGYWYIQCRKDKNEKYKLMEISSRFAGNFCITANLDVNLPLLALTDAEDIDVKVTPNKYEIASDRGYEVKYKFDLNFDTVYFDFDDTLVFNRERYNPVAFAFLLQCKNQRKHIILITRHAYDIHITLKNLCIEERLFDCIIEVSEEKSKADYIKGDKSILIDNSFKDRMEAKERCGIATFDVCNLSALLQ